MLVRQRLSRTDGRSTRDGIELNIKGRPADDPGLVSLSRDGDTLNQTRTLGGVIRVSFETGREHPPQDLKQNPATERRGGLRTKTQEGTSLASENRERPSRRSPVSTCPPDNFPGLRCGPVVSTKAPGGHQRRLAVVVESSLSYQLNSVGSMRSNSRSGFQGVCDRDAKGRLYRVATIIDSS